MNGPQRRIILVSTFAVMPSRSRRKTLKAARGVFGQLIYINWDHQLVVVKLSTWPDFLNVAYNIANLRAIHAIAAAL